jgi:predicted nucleotidyltransferase
VIYGSWAAGGRRPDSDIDLLVVGDADLGDLRRLVRPIGKRSGRTVDVTVMRDEEFRQRLADSSSFVRGVMEAPSTSLIGDLKSLATQ